MKTILIVNIIIGIIFLVGFAFKKTADSYYEKGLKEQKDIKKKPLSFFDWHLKKVGALDSNDKKAMIHPSNVERCWDQYQTYLKYFKQAHKD